MTYKHTVTGTFLSRPNRFIAHVDVNGRTVICHVKNTGRCRELLIPGVTVILEYHPEAGVTGRKTEYDLIGVYKGNVLIGAAATNATLAFFGGGSIAAGGLGMAGSHEGPGIPRAGREPG